MQHLIDEMNKAYRSQRSQSQMTLGKLIKELESYPADKKIENIGSPHSYRGYYSDLSFVYNKGEQTVGNLLNILKTECLNKTFEGYKGGDFYMDENTPVWIADYGCTGLNIVDITRGDVLFFVLREDD